MSDEQVALSLAEIDRLRDCLDYLALYGTPLPGDLELDMKLRRLRRFIERHGT